MQTDGSRCQRKFAPTYFLPCWLMVLDVSWNFSPDIFSHADWWFFAWAEISAPLTFSHAGSIFLIACITFLCSWAIIFLKECYKQVEANVDGRWSVHRPPVHPSTQYRFSKNYYIYNNVRAILFYYYIIIKNRIRWTGGRWTVDAFTLYAE